MKHNIFPHDIQITNVHEAMGFIDNLSRIGMLWHLEDSAHDCFPALTYEDCDTLDRCADQILAQDWQSVGYECPFAYILSNDL